jgi:hypothetical protein
MTAEGLGEMFEGDFADMVADNYHSFFFILLFYSVILIINHSMRSSPEQCSQLVY